MARATDEQLEMCDYPRERYLADDDEHRKAFAPDTFQENFDKKYDDGELVHTEGKLQIGDDAPNPMVWFLQDETNNACEAQLLSKIADKQLLVLDFGSFS